MKKKRLILALVLALTATTLSACSFSVSDLIESLTSWGDDNNVCYYGCPNSKKVRKLNLKKRA